MKSLRHIVKRRRTLVAHGPSFKGPFFNFSSQNDALPGMARIEPYFFVQAFYFILISLQHLNEGSIVEQEHARDVSFTVVVPRAAQNLVERFGVHF